MDFLDGWYIDPLVDKRGNRQRASGVPGLQWGMVSFVLKQSSADDNGKGPFSSLNIARQLKPWATWKK